MSIPENATEFSTIYDSFFARVTDDLFFPMTEADTYLQLQDILINGLNYFEFPRFDLFSYELGEIQEVPSEVEGEPATPVWVGGFFYDTLTTEEINILAMCMVIEWLGMQLTHIDLIKQKFTGTDFKLTSQANHIAKLQSLRTEMKDNCFHLQRLYKRRKRTSDGIQSTMGTIMSTPGYGYKI